MTIRNCLLAGVALVATTGMTAGAGAQSSAFSTFPLKQVGYIKASNPSEPSSATPWL